MLSEPVVITSVEFVGLRSALEPPARFSWGVAHSRNVGLVRVSLSDGTVGWGETSVTFPLWSLEERAATINQGLAPLMVGSVVSSISDIESLTESLLNSTWRLRDLWSPVALSAAVGAAEMALLDAFGVQQGTSVWNLLGGQPIDIPLYAVGFAGTPEQVAEQAQEALDEGYRAIKVRLGFGESTDLDLLASLRNRLGPDPKILADVNMGWSLAEAQRMLPKLQGFGLGWLEEPIGRMDIEGLTVLQNETDIPLAAGENCYSLAESEALIDSRSIEIFMPDPARGGGLLNAVSAAKHALSRSLGYSPHHYASDIGFAAMLTVCAVAGQPQPVLRDQAVWPLRELVLGEQLEIQEGNAKPPMQPGLGPRPNLSIIEEFRVL